MTLGGEPILMLHGKSILLTAFSNTSAADLIEHAAEYEKVFLPNDKIEDSRILLDQINGYEYDLVISIGQRPNIKNKVHIETTAKRQGVEMHTKVDCNNVKELFEKNGINAKISDNAGMSFCNELYFNGLSHLSEVKLKTKMVFVHIPFANNISDFSDFRKRFFDVIAEL